MKNMIDTFINTQVRSEVLRSRNFPGDQTCLNVTCKLNYRHGIIRAEYNRMIEFRYF